MLEHVGAKRKKKNMLILWNAKCKERRERCGVNNEWIEKAPASDQCQRETGPHLNLCVYYMCMYVCVCWKWPWVKRWGLTEAVLSQQQTAIWQHWSHWVCVCVRVCLFASECVSSPCRFLYLPAAKYLRINPSVRTRNWLTRHSVTQACRPYAERKEKR